VLKTFPGSNGLHEVSGSQSSNSLTLPYLERDEANLAVATSPTDRIMPDIMATGDQLLLVPLINQNDDETETLYATSTAGTSPTFSGLSIFSSQQPPTLSELTSPSSYQSHTLKLPPVQAHYNQRLLHSGPYPIHERCRRMREAT
jgi:hypothetical protein